ncbi:spore coat associated protein CotJA [Brevibacillus dissolubilis]|uniref:spore coat associated protein CotJA n=1 Tax=Brevibacillus dissolubilis TaxID=1844116 RepID=UPI001116816D|nr:spore coat associated protein CotJA [Brevibacillus dissolubilis]
MNSSHFPHGSYESSSRDFGSHTVGGHYGYVEPHGFGRPGGYPPINLPPVKPYPPDPYIDQYPLSEALRRGTLFRWLYDPYVNPYRE